MNLNCVILSGRITADAELSYSKKGTAISKFRIAVNDRISEKVNFFNVVCFSKQAESLNEHLIKGRSVGVVGKLDIDQYEREDGSKSISVSVLANNIELGPKAAQSE